MKKAISYLIPILLWLMPGQAKADTITSIDYSVALTANASTGTFAPYMIGSWNGGIFTQKNGIWQTGHAVKRLDMSSRWSWSTGVEYVLGAGSGVRYRDDRPESHRGAVHPSNIRLQQLYGQAKYRGVFILAGMKEQHSKIVDYRLSSGDITRSTNARPIPGVSVGFVDFQNIPFTNGWVQIDGELMYGRFTDTGFERKRFNYYSGVFDADLCYTYKRCYFRTKPDQPLSVTVGMQAAGEFGGYSEIYRAGKLIETLERGFHLRDLWDMFFPKEGSGEGYYKGNSLGSWDFKARYRFANGSRLKAYFQWPWEDGSGIGRKNGWDGLWGLQYDFSSGGIVRSVVVEYLDFTNQSGPIHWAPGDTPGTTVTEGITGGDDYYNNAFYGAYANYGMAIGTPFLMAPLYNTNGFLEFMHNRARGFHAAATGAIGPVDYRAMVSYQKAGGMGRTPIPHRLHCTSALLEGRVHPLRTDKALEVRAQIAFDAGNLRGDNFGALVAVSYTGALSFKKK